MRVRQRPGHVTVPAAARRLGVNYRTVLAMLRRGELRGGRRGRARTWFIEAASVSAHINARVAGALEAITTTEGAVPMPKKPSIPASPAPRLTNKPGVGPVQVLPLVKDPVPNPDNRSTYKGETLTNTPSGNGFGKKPEGRP